MPYLDNCMLSNNIMDYYVVSQGKTSIPGVDDAEELELTDVREFKSWNKWKCIRNFIDSVQTLLQKLVNGQFRF